MALEEAFGVVRLDKCAKNTDFIFLFIYFLIGKKSCIKKLLHQRNEVGKEDTYKQQRKTKNYVQERMGI